MPRRIVRRLIAGLGATVTLGAVAVWAIPGDPFGDFRILQKGQRPSILVFEALGGGGMDIATRFRLNYLPGPDCFVSEDPYMDADEYRRPIVWPPGSRGVRDGDRLGVSVPKGGMIWSSFTRTTFWVGDIVEGAPGAFNAGALTGPLPMLDKQCYGTKREITNLAALDEAYPPGHYALFRLRRHPLPPTSGPELQVGPPGPEGRVR